MKKPQTTPAEAEFILTAVRNVRPIEEAKFLEAVETLFGQHEYDVGLWNAVSQFVHRTHGEQMWYVLVRAYCALGMHLPEHDVGREYRPVSESETAPADEAPAKREDVPSKT